MQYGGTYNTIIVKICLRECQYADLIRQYQTYQSVHRVGIRAECAVRVVVAVRLRIYSWPVLRLDEAPLWLLTDTNIGDVIWPVRVVDPRYGIRWRQIIRIQHDISSERINRSCRVGISKIIVN
jgi:hypothetical protein